MIGFLQGWAAVMFVCVVLVGGQKVITNHPEIVVQFNRWVNSWLAAVNNLWYRPAPKSRRRSYGGKCRVSPHRIMSRAHIHHMRRSARYFYAQHRDTGTPGQLSGQVASDTKVDIIKRGAYKPLTVAQIEILEQLFTQNAILPKDQQWSCRRVYPLFGGDKDRRMKEIGEVKDRIDAKLVEQQKVDRAKRLQQIPVNTRKRTTATVG